MRGQLAPDLGPVKGGSLLVRGIRDGAELLDSFVVFLLLRHVADASTPTTKGVTHVAVWSKRGARCKPFSRGAEGQLGRTASVPRRDSVCPRKCPTEGQRVSSEGQRQLVSSPHTPAPHNAHASTAQSIAVHSNRPKQTCRRTHKKRETRRWRTCARANRPT
jgi:hypothetical protein